MWLLGLDAGVLVWARVGVKIKGRELAGSNGRVRAVKAKGGGDPLLCLLATSAVDGGENENAVAMRALELIRSGEADPLACWADGMDALCEMCTRSGPNAREIYKALLDAGADGMAMRKGGSAGEWAVGWENAWALGELIERGMVPRPPEGFGSLGLWAAWLGRPRCLALLAEKGFGVEGEYEGLGAREWAAAQVCEKEKSNGVSQEGRMACLALLDRMDLAECAACAPASKMRGI